LQKNSRYLVILLLAFFSLLTISKSFYYSSKDGGIDLRIRVVGSRLLATGYSPYFFKWRPADGELLLNPGDNPKRLVNGNVVTPAVLYVIFPMTKIAYPAQRLAWTFLQLMAATAVIILLLRRYNGPSRLLPIAILIVGFLSTDVWLLHVERGQIYIFYALAFSLMYYIYTSRWKYNEFISGFIGGLFIFFRPFAGIVVLGFLLRGKISWLKGWGAGILVGILLFVVPRPALWQDYFHAMKEYNNETLGKTHTPAATIEAMPTVVEGATNIGAGQGFNISHLSALHTYMIRSGIAYTNTTSYLVYGLLLLVLSVLFLRTSSSPGMLFLFAFVVYILAELVLVTHRNPYNVVQWIFPVFLLTEHYRARPFFILLMMALLLLHNFPFIFPFQGLLAELLLLGLSVYALVSVSHVKNKNEWVQLS